MHFYHLSYMITASDSSSDTVLVGDYIASFDEKITSESYSRFRIQTAEELECPHEHLVILSFTEVEGSESYSGNSCYEN